MAEFKDRVNISWDHSDFACQTMLTVRFNAAVRMAVNDDLPQPVYGMVLGEAVERLRREVSDVATGTCHDVGGEEGNRFVCSECGGADRERLPRYRKRSTMPI